MMFSDEEIKESSFTRPGDEIISIREVCLRDKFDKGNGNSLLLNRNELDVPRSLYRDGFYPEGLEQQQARFAWTEEDGNIAALVSEPGFGTTGQTSFGKDLDAALKSEIQEEEANDNEADTSSINVSNSMNGSQALSKKPYLESHLVSSTSSGSSATAGPTPGSTVNDRRKNPAACKVDKTDPRSRLHFVKYVKRHGRTFKLWECGICGREFQHQYTLMRHLPTHTDERNFHCDVCGKSFRQLSTLSQHRAIHSAERPYACEVCYKTFNRVSTLISHRKTHSDEKPYRCHWCPKGFHQKGNLRNHLFTHTNERPYRCNICNKGFNQQSNLVCHKNKAHPDNAPKTTRRSTPRIIAKGPSEPQTDSTRPATDQQCEVTSSVGPYIPIVEAHTWTQTWETSEQSSDWPNHGPLNSMTSGVIVDPIKTYHMDVALATHQTPFALLKPDNGTPVLVKVVDTKLPGGKQMLVPATAEDLRVGGKIVVKNDEPPVREATPLGAVQIRVPVVATVVPKINSSGRLHLTVEEPHHAYHTALSSDVGEVKLEPCTSMGKHCCNSAPTNSVDSLRPAASTKETTVRLAVRPSSSYSLPPPAPSPPLDLISLDLFEPMECIPLGPRITPVNNIDQHPPSDDDSDIFIGKFEEAIPLSDSD